MSSSFFICIFFPRTFFLCKKSSESWDRRWENTCYRVKNVRQSLRSCYPQHHNLLNKFGTFVVITLTRSKSSSKSRILSSFRWAIRSFRSSMAILSAISSSAVCNKKGFGVIINESGDKKSQTITITFLVHMTVTISCKFQAVGTASVCYLVEKSVKNHWPYLILLFSLGCTTSLLSLHSPFNLLQFFRVFLAFTLTVILLQFPPTKKLHLLYQTALFTVDHRFFLANLSCALFNSSRSLCRFSLSALSRSCWAILVRSSERFRIVLSAKCLLLSKST